MRQIGAARNGRKKKSEGCQKGSRHDTAAGSGQDTYKPRILSKIEQGTRTGDFDIWDELEDLFNIHQRKLREIS